jgi:hypothetical protein
VYSLYHGASKPVARSIRDIPYLLADATDVTELAETTPEQAVAALDLSWRRDRALHLLLILLDRDANREASCPEMGALIPRYFDDMIAPISFSLASIPS